MAIWKIARMTREASSGGVTSVIAICSLDETENAPKLSQTVHFRPQPTEEAFIPFSELTEEVVVQWVKDALGKEKLEGLDRLLLAEKNREVNENIAFGLPWEQ